MNHLSRALDGNVDGLDAPPPLDLLQEFANTLDLEGQLEELDSPAALTEWCRRRGLMEAGVGLSVSDLEVAIRAREALRRVALAHSGHDDLAAATAELASATAGARLRLTADPAGTLSLEPVGSPLDRLLGALAAAVVQGGLRGTLVRLKACSDQRCQWVFWDASKNSCGRWCSMAVCGSRAKARAYQHRLRSQARLGVQPAELNR